jgi:two-component system response regulator AgrA
MEGKMLNIYLCEDNDQYRENIAQCIKNSIMIENLDAKLYLVTADPHSIIKATKATAEVGLYFLDIDLKSDINGIVLAREIRKDDPRCFIVFVTAHAEMSYMTFIYKVEALDFVLKDHGSQIKMRIHECILEACLRYESINNNIQKTLNIKCGDKKIAIDYNEILFIETSLNIHKVVLHAKCRQIEFYAKIKELEMQLDERFYRCHRSYIVNKNNIKEIDLANRIIIMVNDESCFVSTRMMKELTK